MHAKLEKEAMKGRETVVVRTDGGRHDEWALRLVRMIVAIKILLEDGCSVSLFTSSGRILGTDAFSFGLN